VVKGCIDPTVVRFKSSRLIFDQCTNNTVHPSVPCNGKFQLHKLSDFIFYIQIYLVSTEFLYIEIPLENPLSVAVTMQNIKLKFEPGTAVACTSVNELTLDPFEIKIVSSF